MTEYDPIKALQEELMGMREVEVAIRNQTRTAEARMSEAEVHLTNIRKVYGYLKIEIDRKQQILQQLLIEKQQKEGQ